MWCHFCLQIDTDVLEKLAATEATVTVYQAMQHYISEIQIF